MLKLIIANNDNEVSNKQFSTFLAENFEKQSIESHESHRGSFATSVEANQHAHPLSLIRLYTVRLLVKRQQNVPSNFQKTHYAFGSNLILQQGCVAGFILLVVPHFFLKHQPLVPKFPGSCPMAVGFCYCGYSTQRRDYLSHQEASNRACLTLSAPNCLK